MNYDKLCNYSGTPTSLNPYRALESDLKIKLLNNINILRDFSECRPRKEKFAVSWTNTLGVRCWHAP